jgi:hypothetical protein
MKFFFVRTAEKYYNRTPVDADHVLIQAGADPGI